MYPKRVLIVNNRGAVKSENLSSEITIIIIIIIIFLQGLGQRPVPVQNFNF
jgi:hypothetical protein